MTNTSFVGKPIKSLKQLIEHKGFKSVYDINPNKAVPVAFVQNYQAWRIYYMIKNGMLFEYKPLKKKGTKNGK
jgi:hypothetical protein